MQKKCPKCDYMRQEEEFAPDYECPQCGIVYVKYNAILEKERQKIRHEASIKKTKAIGIEAQVEPHVKSRQSKKSFFFCHTCAYFMPSSNNPTCVKDKNRSVQTKAYDKCDEWFSKDGQKIEKDTVNRKEKAELCYNCAYFKPFSNNISCFKDKERGIQTKAYYRCDEWFSKDGGKIEKATVKNDDKQKLKKLQNVSDSRAMKGQHLLQKLIGEFHITKTDRLSREFKNLSLEYPELRDECFKYQNKIEIFIEQSFLKMKEPPSSRRGNETDSNDRKNDFTTKLLIPCQVCQKEISKNARFCPLCGEPCTIEFKEHKHTRKKNNTDVYTCPYCKSSVLEDSIKCPSCAEFLDGRREKAREDGAWTIIVGAMLFFWFLSKL